METPPPTVEQRRCPRCNSHSPNLHPAVQEGGEVQVCPHEWHARSTLVSRLRSLADCDARAGEPLGKCMREAADTIERFDTERTAELERQNAALVGLPQFLASARGGGARAKPLRWYKPTDHPQDSEEALWMAHGIGGRYSIQGDAGKFIVWTADDEFRFVTFDTVEACKSWAESDWQQSFARNALGGQP